MAWNLKTISLIFGSAFLIFSSSLAFSQQSSLQTSFFSPSAARLPNAGVVADIVETEHLPYINEIAKLSKKSAAAFTPTGSDLLIQQAEEKYRSGKKNYQELDFVNARSDFDAAIDLMLKASENPTDRPLFERKLEDMVDTIHRYDVNGMGAAVVEAAPQFDKAPLEDIIQMTFPVDPKTRGKIETEAKTTSSALPLTVNDIVLGYINYFSGRGRRTLEYGLTRLGKYQPMISKILAEEGVPQELIHLAQAESGFLPRAVSRAAAGGMWQFVKFRGNQYGLMQTSYSDDRYDPEKATRAAARHLKDLFNEFGDWYLAIAAYNCGPGCVERAVERTGYADYWELRARHAIPAETTNYVPIILAMTIMAKNAQAYGLDQIVPDQPIEYDTVHMNAPTNLSLMSDLVDTTVPEMQQLNPALLRGMAPEGFDLRVPKGKGEEATANLQLVPAEHRNAWRMHRLGSGETLADVGHRFNATAASINSANKFSGSDPNTGDWLLIPAVYHEALNPARTAMARRTTGQTAGHSRTSAVAKGAPARKSTGTGTRVAAAPASKAPVHRSAGAIAQVTQKNKVLNR